MMNEKVTFLVLTKNEELHIERCLNHLSVLGAKIVVVDSNSTDLTLNIVKNFNCNLYNYSSETFSEKLNWALENIPFETEWVIRVDADEIVDSKILVKFHKARSMCNSNINGYYINRRIGFMGKWLKYGGLHPRYSLRIMRPHHVNCEKRYLDEHIIVENEAVDRIDSFVFDNPLISINMWINKHNNYSNLEVRQYFDEIDQKNKLSSQEGLLRFLKNNIYYRIPLFIRPFLYFFYTYFLRLGFMDGRKGFIWAILHSFWYRILIDIKISEHKDKN